MVNPLHELASDSSSSFAKDFEIVQYGTLGVEGGEDLPLFAVLPRGVFDADDAPSSNAKPTVLVTGGTHGYETSGIMGALDFLSSGKANKYLPFLNVVVVPCVSPWAYERVERWVATAVDPNRSFGRKSSEDGEDPLRTEESNKLMAFLDGLGATSGNERNFNSVQWLCHVDLHETTDSDYLEFRPAKAARDGISEYDDHIPDGFYLVGDTVGNHLDWYKAILQAVGRVTHIAPVDEDNTLSGYPAAAPGLILTPKKELCLCAGGAVPDAKYVLTTEVYPDSHRTSAEDCVNAQVEAVCASFDYLIENEIKTK